MSLGHFVGGVGTFELLEVGMADGHVGHCSQCRVLGPTQLGIGISAVETGGGRGMAAVCSPGIHARVRKLTPYGWIVDASWDVLGACVWQFVNSGLDYRIVSNRLLSSRSQ